MKGIENIPDEFDTKDIGGKFLREILSAEWHVIVGISVMLFFTASVLMSGWPSGLLLELRYPYTYDGDGILSLSFIQKTIEGTWVYANNRVGFPFCGSSLAYPVPDTGSLLILKALGRLFGSPQAAMNLFYLLGFPVTFICGYVVLRVIGLSRSFSAAAGILFVFLPFHFLRLNHLFYTWYFVVPVFYYFGYKLFFSNSSAWSASKAALVIVVLLVAASFGVYYAFFGCLLLLASAAAGALRNNSLRCLAAGLAAILVLAFGFFLNTAPNMHSRRAAAHTVNVAKRGAGESEVYGLKLAQLLLPRQGHRVRVLKKWAGRYAGAFPLVNENSTAALGTAGAAGLLLLFVTGFVVMSGRSADPRLAFFSVTVIFLLLFATIGGVSSLFALLISPQLRAWNRISVFIGFGAIAAVFLALQFYLQKHFTAIQFKRVMPAIAAGICLLGVFDQTIPPSPASVFELRAAFDNDRAFVRQIEASVPDKSAIYQLPYVPFPEEPPPYQLPDYALFAGFLHSSSLRWSYGGIKGQEGDLFFKDLAAKPLESQLAEIAKLGFAGIYIDRRGFADHGLQLEKNLRRILKLGPQFQSQNGDLAFFKVKNVKLN